MIRLFIALPVLPDIAEHLLAIRTGLPGVRWLPPENLHVTLRFVGDVSEDVGADAAEELSRVRGGDFTVKMQGHDVFQTGSRLRSIVARIEISPPLKALKQQIDHALDGLVPETRRRRFAPHVTLARLNRDAKHWQIAEHLESVDRIEKPSWIAEAFALYSSCLNRGGATYFIEETHFLVEGMPEGAGSDDGQASFQK